MSEHLNRVADPLIDWSTKKLGSVTHALWGRLGARLSAYRRRWVAAVVYGELSKLSGSELERRGIARGDLHWAVSDMAER